MLTFLTPDTGNEQASCHRILDPNRVNHIFMQPTEPGSLEYKESMWSPQHSSKPEVNFWNLKLQPEYSRLNFYKHNFIVYYYLWYVNTQMNYAWNFHNSILLDNSIIYYSMFSWINNSLVNSYIFIKCLKLIKIFLCSQNSFSNFQNITIRIHI